MSTVRKLLLAGIGLVLIAGVVAGGYKYQAERQRQAVEAMLLLQEGINQFTEEQFEVAVQTLRSIPEGAIVDWRVPYYTGASLIKLADYESAAVSLEEAMALNSEEADIPFALGVVYYKLGNLGLAKSYFHSVLEIEPGNQEAKGLMDIMAKLERHQPEVAAPKPESSEAALPEDHPQISDH
jgi:tetratricopeptide (TPR) repeat protein